MNFVKLPVLSDSLLNAPSSVLHLPSVLGASATSPLNPLSQSIGQGVSGASAIAFIDANVSDYQALLAGIAPGTEVHLLDSSQDAVTQITNTLLGRQNIASLHIVSHGEKGGLNFGSSVLNLTDLPQYAAQLKTWSKALTNDADILLYGCNVAEGELGQAFVQIISELAEADVAASNNLTGKDGDWNLEVITGEVESSLVFDSNVTSAYAYNLDNILGETFRGNDVTNASWIFNTTGTQPQLTARSTTAASPGGIPGGGGDSVGSGALRLTSAALNQASFVIYNRPINASSGFSIAFNIHAYGGNGADGISFFLIDGNTSPTTAGSTGGSLGYSSNGITPGLVGGYLGIGFDEFGNFSNTQYGAGAPVSGNSTVRDSIAVHGSQANSYSYLTGTGTLSPGIDNTTGSRSTSQKAVKIDLTPAGLLSVQIDLDNNSVFSGADEVPAALQNYNVVASNGALPSTFKFGFSASTGGSTNVHEITGLDVSTFNNLPYVPLVNFTSSSASVSEGAASLTLTAQVDVATSNTVVVPVTLSGTATNGTDYTVSNGSITILPGQLTGSTTLNPINDLTVEPNETAVVTMGTPTNAQLSPQNNVLTATIVDNEYSLSATGSPSYIENAAPIVIAPIAAITGDLTASAINSATVSLGSGFASAEDRLGIQGQSGTSGLIASTSITWSHNTTSGVLSFSGTDTAANYQAALRQVVYSNVSDAPSVTSRTVVYAIQYNGGQQATSSSNPSITVTPVNDAPTIAAPASVTVVEDSATAVTGITFADIDAGSGSVVTATFSAGVGTLAAIGSGGVSVGGTSSSLTLSGTIVNLNAFIAANNLTYQTVLNSNTTLTLGVSINDNGNTPVPALTATTDVAINIAPVNDAPSLTGNATLAAVTQNSTNPSGSSLTSLFGSLFTDVDAGASLSGLAIVGNTADSTTQGRWQYSLDSTTWTNIGVVADGASALALAASTLVRFVPAARYQGTPPGLTVRALDNTYSGGLTTGTTPVTVDTTTNGGSTAIAGTTAALSTSVTPSLPQLVWQNSRTGQSAVWPLNGFTLQNSYFLPTVAEAGWQVASSTADFNQDGITDILWRNQVTGSNSIWQLSSTGFQAGYFLPPVPDLNWQIAGTADLNRDGVTDIIWRNKASGENVIWQQNGATLQSSYFLPTVTEAGWQIVSTAGDFNNDGVADLLWRNQITGANSIWQLTSTGSLQTGYFIQSVADRNWRIVGTGDFNRDGIADIVWRNNASGENAIWQVNGGTLQSVSFLLPVADTNWQIVGVSDLGGDATPELLWRNQAAGTAIIWQLNGFSYAQLYQLPNVPDPNWSVRPFVPALNPAAPQVN